MAQGAEVRLQSPLLAALIPFCLQFGKSGQHASHGREMQYRLELHTQSPSTE